MIIIVGRERKACHPFESNEWALKVWLGFYKSNQPI